MKEDVKMDVLDGGPVEGLVGFFNVQFKGSPQNPTDFQVLHLPSFLPTLACSGCEYGITSQGVQAMNQWQSLLDIMK